MVFFWYMKSLLLNFPVYDTNILLIMLKLIKMITAGEVLLLLPNFPKAINPSYVLLLVVLLRLHS